MRIDSEDFDASGIRIEYPREELDGRRLSRTVWTDKREQLSGFHGEGNAVDGLHRLTLPSPQGIALALGF